MVTGLKLLMIQTWEMKLELRIVLYHRGYNVNSRVKWCFYDNWQLGRGKRSNQDVSDSIFKSESLNSRKVRSVPTSKLDHRSKRFSQPEVIFPEFPVDLKALKSEISRFSWFLNATNVLTSVNDAQTGAHFGTAGLLSNHADNWSSEVSTFLCG